MVLSLEEVKFISFSEQAKINLIAKMTHYKGPRTDFFITMWHSIIGQLWVVDLKSYGEVLCDQKPRHREKKDRNLDCSLAQRYQRI